MSATKINAQGISGKDASFDYYYSNEADQYTFYRLPKVLYSDDRYNKNLSGDAKILYGLMLDRMCLPAKNGWLDDQNRVYMYFTLDGIQEHMNCGHGKAVNLLAELDVDKGTSLIERMWQGQGRPTKIYIKNFFSSGDVQTSENRTLIILSLIIINLSHLSKKLIY